MTTETPIDNNTTPSQPSTPATPEVKTDAPAQPPAQTQTDVKTTETKVETKVEPQKTEQKDLLFDDKVKNPDKVDPNKNSDGTDKTQEQKDAEAKAAKDAEDKAKADEKPIEYKDFTIPEDIKVDAAQLEWVKTFASERKMSQEDAQALLDKGVEMQHKNLDFWNETKKGWREAVEKDPVLGGHNLSTSVKTADEIVTKFAGTPAELAEMQDDLVLLGLGNKKSFIRFCNNIARATKDDKMSGNSGNTVTKSADLAERMYPNMASEKKPS